MGLELERVGVGSRVGAGVGESCGSKKFIFSKKKQKNKTKKTPKVFVSQIHYWYQMTSLK